MKTNMKNIIIMLIVFIFSIFYSNAQGQKDSIFIQKHLPDYEYFQKCECKRLSVDDLEKIVSSNEEALNLIQSTKINGTLSDYTGSIGVLLIFKQIMDLSYKNKINWTMIGIGAGLTMVSIPLKNKYNNDMNKAVDIYNSKLLSDNFWDKSELNLTINSNSIGFVLNF